MKKSPLLHAELSHLIATLGHGDSIVIGDAGLPVPRGTRCIDLAVMRGVPSFMQVLEAVMSEMAVERALVADELSMSNQARVDEIRECLPGAELGSVTHSRLKDASTEARAVIRTGDCTPYSNVVLFAGVAFDGHDRPS